MWVMVVVIHFGVGVGHGGYVIVSDSAVCAGLGGWVGGCWYWRWGGCLVVMVWCLW